MTQVTIRPAFTIKGGREVRDGWDVFVAGAWHDRFRLKRDAQREARKLA